MVMPEVLSPFQARGSIGLASAMSYRSALSEASTASYSSKKPFMLINCFALLLVHVCILFQALHLLASTPSLHSFTLTAVEVAILSALMYVGACNLSPKMMLDELALADRNLLLMALVSPVANLSFFILLPTFDVALRHWPAYHAFLIILGVAAADFPMSHVVLQWIISTPILMFLDFQHYCANLTGSHGRGSISASGTGIQHMAPDSLPCVAGQACADLSSDSIHTVAGSLTLSQQPQQSYAFAWLISLWWDQSSSQNASHSFMTSQAPAGCSWAEAAGYLLLRGPIFLATGLITVAAASILSGKYAAPPPSSEEGLCVDGGVDGMPKRKPEVLLAPTDDDYDAVSEGVPYPLKSFGLDFFDDADFQWLVRQCESLVRSLSIAMGAEMVVRLVCLPVAGFYMLRALLARVDHARFQLGAIQPEEWMIAMVSYFMLGKECTSLDWSTLGQSVGERLQAPQKSLMDALYALRKQSPQLLREVLDVRKRLRGAPQSGLVSIVVTDIEGYSDLMKAHPDLMMSALLTHNKIIEKTKYQHFGYVIEQEGDSFSLIFEDAADAVKFCTEAQQLLQSQAWPAGLFDEMPSPLESQVTPSVSFLSVLKGSMSSLGMHMVGSKLSVTASEHTDAPNAEGSSQEVSKDNAQQPQETASGGSQETLSSLLMKERLSNLSFQSFATSPPSKSSLVQSGHQMLFTRPDRQRQDAFQTISSTMGGVEYRPRANSLEGLRSPFEKHYSGNIHTNIHTNHIPIDPASAVDTAAGAGGVLPSSPRPSAIMRALFRNRSTAPPDAASPPFLSGLRVRMGIATGHLGGRNNVGCSAVMEFAKRFSNAARGGQTLMCEATFKMVKDMGKELAKVDPCNQRLSARLMMGFRSYLHNLLRTVWPELVLGSPAHQGEGEAHLVHMGQYFQDQRGNNWDEASTTTMLQVWELFPVEQQDAGRATAGNRIPGGSRKAPSRRRSSVAWLSTLISGPRSSSMHMMTSGSISASDVVAGAHSLQAADSTRDRLKSADLNAALNRADSYYTGSFAMEPDMSYTESPPRSPSVYSQRNKDMGAGPFHVYQVLPTRLQARGAYFGSKITLPDEFKMVLKPYYDAPGARQTAPSSYRRLSTMAPTPTLPTVTIVFVMVEPCDGLTKTIASDIHKELLTLICSILRQIPGSYLVLEQEGDMKYMSAFDSAEAACSFCLAVQECSMYILWSKTVLSLWPEQWDKSNPGNHQLLFRGPRLKMGVCEGVPGSIMPNHLGRADYHGACVNQAARFMDAAAHGGQIACEENTATRVMDAWAAQARAMEQREREEGDELFCDPASDVFHSCSHNAVFGSPDSTVPEDSSLIVATDLDDPQIPSDEYEDVFRELYSGKGHNDSHSLFNNKMNHQGMEGPGFVSRSVIGERRLVAAVHLGEFTFKGSDEVVSMVNVTLATLSKRSFPKQPPKGKGSQVSQGTGVVLASAQACELRIVSEYRHLFQGVATATSSLLLSRGESSSIEAPLSRRRNGSASVITNATGGMRNSRLQDNSLNCH